MKRRPTLILEVLIAFALVSLCGLPLLYPTFKAARMQTDHYRTLQLNARADTAFAAIRNRLYENDIPWEAFSAGTINPRIYHGTLDGATYQLYADQRWPRRAATRHRLLCIDIQVDDQTHSYSLYITREDPA